MRAPSSLNGVLEEPSSLVLGLLPQARGRVAFRAEAQLLLALYLFLEVFSAPLKFLFYSTGLSLLTYVSKAGSLVLIFLVVFVVAKVPRVALVIFIVMLMATLRTVTLYDSLFQGLFGFWVVVPFLFGVFYNRHLFDGRLIRIFEFFWVVALIGVLGDIIVDYPWKGSSIVVGGVEQDVARDWSSAGRERLSGFSQISGQVADQLFFLGALLLLIPHARRKHIVVFMTVLALYLTTMKTHLIAYVVLAFLEYVRRPIISNVLIAVFGLAVQFFPLYSYFRFSDGRAIDGAYEVAIGNLPLGSFFQRMSFMWPRVIDYTIERGGWLFGTGIGGIGSALGRNENEDTVIYGNLKFTAADGLFAYAFPVLGVWAIAFITMLAIAAIRSSDGYVKNVIGACFVLGMGQTVVAGTLTAIFFGAACGIVFSAKRVS